MANANGAALTADHNPPASFDGTAALTVALTPSNATAKVLLKASITTNISLAGAHGWNVRFRRGTSTVRTVEDIASDTPPAGSEQSEPVVIEAFDSPASTSQQSYTLEFDKDSDFVRIAAGTFMTAEEW